MRAFSRWIVGCSLWVPVFIACGKSNAVFDDGDGGASSSGGGQSGSSGGFSSSGGGEVIGTFTPGDSSMPNGDSGPCKGGKYEGTFAGSYNSHLTAIGIPIPVTGNVDLTLDQEGTSGQMCVVAGEGFEQCSNVFSLQNGTITGVADTINIGDASIGGFPYFCTMSGTLDCAAKKLLDGWIQCTYCIGPLADGGLSCTLFDGVGGTTGVGGHFAGPLTANYDYGALAFVMGSWNGAEALAGNDGGSPGPDGGTIWNYLSDAGYLGPNDFGGLGNWNASYKK